MSHDALAVIPARGGSKRIPRKNVRLMSGRPLITWAIDLAKKTGEFARIVVSTDDEEIASIARLAGAEVPFIRPTDLSGDHATTGSAMAHAVSELMSAGGVFNDVCCIYPGALLVPPAAISESRRLLREPSDVDFVMAVVDYGHPLQRALTLRSDGVAQPLYPEYTRTRTQDLQRYWHDAGQFYWGRSVAWLEDREVHGNARAFPLRRTTVIDIDDLDDWGIAERLHSAERINLDSTRGRD